MKVRIMAALAVTATACLLTLGAFAASASATDEAASAASTAEATEPAAPEASPAPAEEPAAPPADEPAAPPADEPAAPPAEPANEPAPTQAPEEAPEVPAAPSADGNDEAEEPPAVQPSAPSLNEGMATNAPEARTVSAAKPHAEGRTFCDGSAEITLSNGASATQAAHFTVTTTGGFSWSGNVAPGGQQVLMLPIGFGSVTATSGSYKVVGAWAPPPGTDCKPQMEAVSDCASITIKVTNDEAVVSATVKFTSGGVIKSVEVAAGETKSVTFDAKAGTTVKAQWWTSSLDFAYTAPREGCVEMSASSTCAGIEITLVNKYGDSVLFHVVKGEGADDLVTVPAGGTKNVAVAARGAVVSWSGGVKEFEYALPKGCVTAAAAQTCAGLVITITNTSIVEYEFGVTGPQGGGLNIVPAGGSKEFPFTLTEGATGLVVTVEIDGEKQVFTWAKPDDCAKPEEPKPTPPAPQPVGQPPAQATDDMPETGQSLTGVLVAGAVLLSLGMVLMVVGRRRRTHRS